MHQKIRWVRYWLRHVRRFALTKNIQLRISIPNQYNALHIFSDLSKVNTLESQTLAIENSKLAHAHNAKPAPFHTIELNSKPTHSSASEDPRKQYDSADKRTQFFGPKLGLLQPHKARTQKSKRQKQLLCVFTYFICHGSIFKAP